MSPVTRYMLRVTLRVTSRVTSQDLDRLDTDVINPVQEETNLYPLIGATYGITLPSDSSDSHGGLNAIG
jgi:hypothetical protein